ncbi:hypothetical protein RHMOL_Rhmol01G0059900 [Rhododendron molle]|uniref:Uncharacterized protein n=1 Tax=Rhododendron molle TaxID=49168 RepID=A0ACC0PYG1_RHOML|nr:hypothetical protein RHMOL_Rhmol01G0059900 [Rhododendron molle]
MISMTSLCGGVHTILNNEREGNVHPLLRRVNKIALNSGWFHVSGTMCSGHGHLRNLRNFCDFWYPLRFVFHFSAICRSHFDD